jgi:type VI secretion system protein ImpA
MLDIDSLLSPVSAEAACGPNLEYGPEFSELERSVAGRPERQVGDTVVAAEPADWRSVAPRAVALFGATKDLRVAVHLSRALLEMSAYAGLGEGLALVRRLVAERWDSVHPVLDADEGNDPTRRLNAVASLSHRDMINALRAAPLLRTRTAGELRLRDIEAARLGKADGKAGSNVNVDAALAEASVDELAKASSAVELCLTEAKALEEAWAAHAADLGGAAPDLTELTVALARAAHPLRTRLAELVPEANGVGGHGAAATAPGTAAATGGAPRVLTSRDDVVRALDAICDYYSRYEPTSPVPLLLERCKRLARMSFLDIVKDMLPDGMAKIETIAGKPQE